MSKRSEDNIERFFRKAASQYNDTSTEYREEDWRKMEKMLDEQADRAAVARSRNWKIGGGIGTGVVLLLLSFYFFTDVFNQFDSDSQVADNSNSSDVVVDKGETSTGNSLEQLPDQNPADLGDPKPAGAHVSGDNETDQYENQNLIPDGGAPGTPEPENRKPTSADVPSGKQPSTENKKVFQAGVTPQGDREISDTGIISGKSDVITQPRLHDDRRGQENERTSAESNRHAEYKEKDHLLDGIADAASMKETQGETSIGMAYVQQKETSNEGQLTLEKPVGDNSAISLTDARVKKGQDIHDAEDSLESAANADAVNVPATSRQGTEKDANSIVIEGNDRARTENNDAGGVKRNNGVVENASEAIVAANLRDSSKTKALRESNDQESRHQDDTTKLQDKDSPVSKWNIALVAAPDFSSTGSVGFSSPGSAVGLTVQYRIFDRIAVSTGLIRTSKKYAAPGSDYHPPQGYWARRTNGITPDRINGTCMVLEIPLTLQYNLMEVEKNLLFVSAGISSYLMQNQRYTYKFPSENPGADTEWSSREPVNHFFSVGSITAGYERAIKPQLLIGLAPYVKVPFSGVGWPSVRLYTTGVYFTLRYRIIKSGANL